MDVKDLVKLTTFKMKEVKIEKDRTHMISYMKDQYDFFGVKAPARKQIIKDIKNHLKALDNPSLFQYAEELWKLPHRELQYCAVDVLGSRSKKWDESYLPRIENLIVTKSWWDTVDLLAANIAGGIFARASDIRREWVSKWSESDNMWLIRSALLHQLRYKEDVDLEMLFDLIRSHIESKEFFINKASGWALRQASKFYPAEIRSFITDHPNLSSLTIKEGSKYLN